MTGPPIRSPVHPHPGETGALPWLPGQSTTRWRETANLRVTLRGHKGIGTGCPGNGAITILEVLKKHADVALSGGPGSAGEQLDLVTLEILFSLNNSVILRKTKIHQ